MSTPEQPPADVQAAQPEIDIPDATAVTAQAESEFVSARHWKRTKRAVQIVVGRRLHALKLSLRRIGGQRLARWISSGRWQKLQTGIIAGYAVARRHPRLSVVVTGSGLLALCLLFFRDNGTEQVRSPEPAQSVELDEVRVFPVSSSDSQRELPTAIDTSTARQDTAPETNGQETGGPRFPQPHRVTHAAPPGRAVWLKGTIEAVNGRTGGSQIQPISFQDWPPAPRRANIVPPPKRFQRDYR